MDTAPENRSISEGDRVTLFLKGKRHTTVIRSGRMDAGSFSFPGESLMGQTYGRNEIAGMELVVLPALARDHMETLDRGPQIILPGDASTILFYADIHEGSVVLEAGTGSGSMTIALASAVGEKGRVITMDNVPKHLEGAKRNVKRAGYLDRVEFLKGDIRDKSTFAELFMSQPLERVDSVVLDMPDPWAAVNSIRGIMKPGGILAGYIPTTNQVERFRMELQASITAPEITDHGFIDVFTMETLRREMVVKKGAVRPDYSMLGHTGYLTFARRI